MASESEAPSFAEETANNMLKELQSWWEIPSMAQYISLFREAFNLPEIEIEELENGLIDDCVKGPNEWLQNLVIAFLKSIMPGRVQPTNWELQLKRLIKRKWILSPFAEKENPFQDEEKSFHELNLRSKVEVLYCFCLYRLDNNDITEVMKSMDAEALRVQKLGIDDAGNTYWYFYGTRLYKEEPLEEKKTWDEEWDDQKRKSLTKKRGRGRPPKKQKIEKEVEEEPKDDQYMNISGKSRWSVVCDTLEEWLNFTEKFLESKSKNEKSLFQIIQENFLPTLSKIYEEKERKLQEKIRELLPAREKIVTRRETRRLRGDTGGDINYALLNGYDSDDESKPPTNDYKAVEVKSRAERLEERNKRASEAGTVNSGKRVKHGEESKDSSESSQSSTSLDSPEGGELDLMSQMVKLLSSVKLHKDAWPFLYPVNKDEAPGYYEIIKDPVDLSTIENRLYKGDYETVGDLDEDFSRMVSNCELYNGENHEFSKMAQTLRKYFRKEVANLLEMLETVDSSNPNSEESNDSQYHSSSNSNASSPPHEPPVVESKEHKKVKSKKKKRRHHGNQEALDLLAQATHTAVQENTLNSSTPPQKKSPIPQEIRSAPYVPSKNMPCYAPSSSSQGTVKTSVPATSSTFISANPPSQVMPCYARSSSSPGTVRPSAPVTSSTFISRNPSPQVLPCYAPSSSSPSTVKSSNPVTSSTFIAMNPSPQVVKTHRPVIVRSITSSVEKRISPVENVASTSINTDSNKTSNNTVQQTVVNQPKTSSVVLPTSPSNQNNFRIHNAMPPVTMQSNTCMPNGLVQQVVIPAGTQLPNTGQQFVIASPQNAIRILSKEQSAQLQNSVGQLNQGYVKVVPQLIASAPGVQSFQVQTLSPNNSTQTFTQVSQNPQFLNVPYVVSNQNSTSQSAMNFQPFQMPPRPMHISGQGNG